MDSSNNSASSPNIDIKKVSSGRTLGSELTAPTPNNTPSVQAPIAAFKKATATAPAIPEEPSSVTTTARPGDLFAQNSQLVSMLQGKLGSLVNAPSGYVASLPRSVKRRIIALKALNRQQLELEKKFHEEVLELEKKYNLLYQPVMQRRAEIVSGQEEANEEEVEAGKKEDDEVDEEEEDEEGEDVKGIPEFWLTILKNHPMLMETLTDRDEEALEHLTDVRLSYLQDPAKPGFRLDFEFNPSNPCFTDRVLTKTYYYKFSDNLGDLVFDSAEGCTIHWKDGKDLSTTTQTKRQRNKVTKQERVITTTVPCDTFFNFFKPPQVPDQDSDVDEEDEEEMEHREQVMEELEQDYAMGEELKDKVIPHAVDWFTGKALEYEGLDLDDGGFEDSDEDSDDDDDDSDSD